MCFALLHYLARGRGDSFSPVPGSDGGIKTRLRARKSRFFGGVGRTITIRITRFRGTFATARGQTPDLFAHLHKTRERPTLGASRYASDYIPVKYFTRDKAVSVFLSTPYARARE